MSDASECHVVKGLIAVRFDPEEREEQVRIAQGILGEGPITDPTQVLRILGKPVNLTGPPGMGGDQADPYQGDDGAAGGPDPLTAERLAQFLEPRMALWLVADGQEHQMADQLRAENIEAAPIHPLGSLNHITRASGTEPRHEFTPDTAPVLPEPSPGQVIAVVDSGVTRSIPKWLKLGVKTDGEEDVEVLPEGELASHGVFVAGLIRRIAPEHTIHMARTAYRSIDIYDGDNDASVNPTTELDVAVAIRRLIARLRRLDTEVDVLNLSLGGSICSDEDVTMLVISEAIDQWRSVFPDSVVFAAGGNHPNDSETFPASLEQVRGVGAAAEGGDKKVWDDNENPQPAGDRQWVSDIAPGVDVTSPGGREPDKWVYWNGSSFATAVASACYASQRPSQEVDGITYWSRTAMNYTDIPGLTDFNN